MTSHTASFAGMTMFGESGEGIDGLAILGLGTGCFASLPSHPTKLQAVWRGPSRRNDIV